MVLDFSDRVDQKLSVWLLLDVDDKQIGKIIFDGGKVLLEGDAERFRDVPVYIGKGKDATVEDGEAWFRNALQLGHPPYLRVVEG